MPHRFFIDEAAEDVVLEGEEFRHARDVLRVGEGTEIVLLDNSGYEYRGIVTKADKKQMNVHVLGREPGTREPKTQVFLLFGFLKSADKNEYIVQKAVELGVTRIGVFASAYSSAYLNENKLARLNKVSKEAAKQCLRSIAPAVVSYPDLESALDAATEENKLFACEFCGGSEVDLAALRGSCAIVVGSEGGFSEEEFELARAKGFAGVSLGRRILRAETAAVALTSVVQFALGELR